MKTFLLLLAFLVQTINAEDIALAWDNNNTTGPVTVASSVVEMKTGQGAFTQIATTNSLTATAAGLQPGVYVFRVYFVLSNGAKSPYSDELSVTVSAPLQGPSNLRRVVKVQ